MNRVSNVRALGVDTYEAEVDGSDRRMVASGDLIAQLAGGADPTAVVSAVFARVENDEAVVHLDEFVATNPELVQDIRAVLQGTVG